MNSRLRAIWREMHRRCTDPKVDRYPRYGGRGIQICAEWRDWPTFEQWAMELGYRPGLTIERIDGDGNYEPTNCLWIPRSRQARNRSTARMLTAFDETKSLIEWIEDDRCRTSYNVLHLRVARRGWDHERAITTPTMRNNE